MYYTRSQNSCTLPVIKARLLDWLYEGYLLQDGNTARQVPATLDNVALLLEILNRDGAVYLVGLNGRDAVKVYHNKKYLKKGATKDLPYSYDLKTKGYIAPIPARASQTRYAGYLATN